MNPAETRQITLTEFLLARIAEDEAAAKFFDWAEPRHYEVDGVEASPEYVTVYMSPARVLAECEAKRRIIKFHESWPVLVQTPPEFGPSDPSDPQSMTFRMTQQITWVTEQEYRTRFGDEPPTTPMLHALASIYADHPDFREEWRA